MKTGARLETDDRTLTIRIPMSLTKRGGRKVILGPAARPTASGDPSKAPSALVKAVARAYRWTRLLETGRFATMEELASLEKVNPSYLARILRLPLLSPAIVESILEGRQIERIDLKRLSRPFPLEWEPQGQAFKL